MANIFIWVKSKDRNVLTQSVSLQNYTDYFIWKSLADMQLKPLLHLIHRGDFVWCGGPLIVNGLTIGKLYVGLDITRNQRISVTMMINLSVANILAITSITVTINIYQDLPKDIIYSVSVKPSDSLHISAAY